MALSVREAVIPAAGLGTRFFPATLTTPKEMLPLLHKPVIHRIMDELLRSGVEKAVLIISPQKEDLRKYLELDAPLAGALEQAGREDLQQEIRRFSTEMHLEFVYQQEPLGLGHAVSLAGEQVRGAAFFVVLPDWLFLGERPAVEIMAGAFEQGRDMLISTMPVAEEETSSYGILHGPFITDRIFEVHEIVEKPAPRTIASNLAISGRYILPREIFSVLKRQSPGSGGEIQLTDAIATLKEQGRGIYGLNFPEHGFDLGTVKGWLAANSALFKVEG